MKNKYALILLIYLVVTFIALSFIPPVEQLGKMVRLIIFHGMLSMTGLYIIYASGLLGILYLMTKQEALGAWSREVGWISVVVWTIGTALSAVSMQLAWGGMMWEPRTVAAVTMLLLGAGKEYLVRSNGGSTRLFAMGNAVFAFSVIVIRQALEFVFHPENPTGRSDSVIIRLLPWMLILFTVLTIAELVRQRLRQSKV
jgi:hypothetical protein